MPKIHVPRYVVVEVVVLGKVLLGDGFVSMRYNGSNGLLLWLC